MSLVGSVLRSLLIATAVTLVLRATGLFSLFKATFVGRCATVGRYCAGTWGALGLGGY